MDARVRKLQLKGIDLRDAQALVAAGFATPRDIKAASDRELRAVEGVGPAKLKQIRERFPALR